ncbi:hypothetical protein ABET11_07750 [Priestia megaterium]|uniref:hypothetical protein n=1 Tax=Priestia TaxID=2800373 RepID=UPI0007CDDECA|nr:hypothetical protein [Priestia megaterium]MCF6797248.1 hypothetical protein [Bacillus sp. ET1]RFB36276.1 hypothetical protein DZB86_13820 [Bacillus sp. RC]ANF47133.1 hypothetical protein AZK53_15975 [Priestia megaterium]MBD8844011.1 hypothetical protein [Priestia megaterium]MBW0929841.1 hypothetical protein [Priestia megaterium]
MKLIKQILATIASSICGGAVCIEIFELNSLGYTGILDYLSILLIGVYLTTPFIIIVGIPCSIAITSIMKYINSLKILIELILYLLFGIVGALAVLTLFLLSDGISAFSLFPRILIVTLSCSLPFGLSSILINRLYKKTI